MQSLLDNHVNLNLQIITEYRLKYYRFWFLHINGKAGSPPFSYIKYTGGSFARGKTLILVLRSCMLSALRVGLSK